MGRRRRSADRGGASPSPEPPPRGRGPPSAATTRRRNAYRPEQLRLAREGAGLARLTAAPPARGVPGERVAPGVGLVCPVANAETPGPGKRDSVPLHSQAARPFLYTPLPAGVSFLYHSVARRAQSFQLWWFRRSSLEETNSSDVEQCTLLAFPFPPPPRAEFASKKRMPVISRKTPSPYRVGPGRPPAPALSFLKSICFATLGISFLTLKVTAPLPAERRGGPAQARPAPSPGRGP